MQRCSRCTLQSHPTWLKINGTSFCFNLTFDMIIAFKLPRTFSGPIGWDCRIHQLQLCRGVRFLATCVLKYDTKQFDSSVRVMKELWGMQSSPSLPLLPGPLSHEVVAPDRAKFMGQIELNSAFMLNWVTWNRSVLTFNKV